MKGSSQAVQTGLLLEYGIYSRLLPSFLLLLLLSFTPPPLLLLPRDKGNGELCGLQ